MKKNQETQPAPSSSDETDSDASSSSSEGEALPSTPLPPSAVAKKSAAQNKPAEPSADKKVDAGRDSDDSDSDSPIAPKSLTDGSKLKKPRSKPNSKPSSNPASSPPKTPAKRSLPVGVEDSKRPKKEKGEGVGVGAEEEGKKLALFQRLWSDDDEIVVLEGILEYKEEKGADPMADTVGFHDFIKKSLHVDFDRKQMVDKIRRLKKRYENSVVNKKKNFTAHERKAFDLSKKIWGNNGDAADADRQTKSNMKTRIVSKAETSKGVNGYVVSSNGSKVSLSAMGKEENSWQFIGQSSISMGLDENIVKVGLELCRPDKKAEIEEMWKQLYVEESNLFLRKLDLAREESMMITEALKSGKK